ncbi:hypothetical protein GMORB2_1545 [Geosmithia morbida]|uniref:Xylanolytic transcriptional activator regulatory domain-containing protein n=1 Tax=Geosmithia morbida TaxID=1094350 RepID=A0A9P4YU46_9HYPO|nr:uncharacterized protein GMORB2_1545 [Geosmithia morbida]KAF4121706.1 hypothetical protein GMORB2_1545 [Geosmithia morbida]
MEVLQHERSQTLVNITGHGINETDLRFGAMRRQAKPAPDAALLAFIRLSGKAERLYGSIVYVGQEYSNVNYLLRNRARNQAAYHFPANQISREYTGHELYRIPREAFTMPSPELVDELLGSYFRHVNPGFPILDEDIFMAQYRNKDPANPPSLLVLQAVLLVGAHVSRDRPDRDDLKVAFFRRAKMLFDARFEWNRDVVVQAALLLTWHSEGVEDIGANSYHWVGVAARTAQGLGMHRDTGPTTLVAHDKRLWKRLWWILFQFDVLVSLSYGRPQAINLDDCDVPELGPADFDHLGENVDADFLIHQTQLCCVISRAVKRTYGLKASPPHRRAALVEADRMLARWISRLPVSLRRAGDQQNASFWQAVLHINYNNFLILLHRPPPRPASIPGANKQDDMKICFDAATTMASLFETIVAQGRLRYMNFFAVDALFTGLIQLSAEMRGVNPILSANAKTIFDSALGILHSLSEYWLNGEMILRLFRDTSENLRQQLQIGERTIGGDHREDSTNSESAMTAAEPQPDKAAGCSSIDWGSGMDLTHAAMLNDQLDWSNMYWEQSGFTSLSPFTNMTP